MRKTIKKAKLNLVLGQMTIYPEKLLIFHKEKI